jgi:hypothetical protein
VKGSVHWVAGTIEPLYKPVWKLPVGDLSTRDAPGADFESEVDPGGSGNIKTHSGELGLMDYDTAQDTTIAAGQTIRFEDFKVVSSGAPEPNPSLKDAVNDSPSDQQGAPGPMGTKIAKPHLKTAPVAVQGSDTKAGDQLLSAAAANGNLTPNYDAGGAKSAGSLKIPRVLGQTPGAVDLESHIPAAAKSDKEIQQSMAYYEKLDGRKLDALAKVAAVQKQIDSGTGDANVLSAQKSTLDNEVKQYEADQQQTTSQIQKRLTTINVPWIESSSPAGASQ